MLRGAVCFTRASVVFSLGVGPNGLALVRFHIIKKEKSHNNTKVKTETAFFFFFNCDSKQTIGGFRLVWLPLAWYSFLLFFFFLGIGNGILQRLVQHQTTQYPASEELSIGKIKFKAFDLGGHQIARWVWKDCYTKVDRSIYQSSLMWMLSWFLECDNLVIIIYIFCCSLEYLLFIECQLCDSRLNNRECGLNDCLWLVFAS